MNISNLLKELLWSVKELTKYMHDYRSFCDFFHWWDCASAMCQPCASWYLMDVKQACKRCLVLIFPEPFDCVDCGIESRWLIPLCCKPATFKVTEAHRILMQNYDQSSIPCGHHVWMGEDSCVSNEPSFWFSWLQHPTSCWKRPCVTAIGKSRAASCRGCNVEEAGAEEMRFFALHHEFRLLNPRLVPMPCVDALLVHTMQTTHPATPGRLQASPPFLDRSGYLIS